MLIIQCIFCQHNRLSIEHNGLIVAYSSQVGLPWWLRCVKESACNAGDLGLILGWEDPLEKGMATHSRYSCLKNFMDRGTWLWSRGLQRGRHDRATNTHSCARTHTHTHTHTYTLMFLFSFSTIQHHHLGHLISHISHI